MDCDYEAEGDGFRCTRCGDVAKQLTHRQCGKRQSSDAHVELLVRAAVDAYGEDSYGLGDMTADALSAIGITKERVTRWFGAPCKCPERQQRLNEVGRKIAAFLGGSSPTVDHPQSSTTP